MSIKRIEKVRAQQLRETIEYKETKIVLHNLMTNLSTLEKYNGILPTPYESYEQNCLNLYDKWEQSLKISSVLRDLKNEVSYPSERHKAMSQMLSFMGLVESLGVTLTDIILILMIANGTAIHVRKDGIIKHASTFQDLEKIDNETRKRTLLDGKINKKIVSNILNFDVRNIAAHLGFKIENDGKIITNGGGVIEINDTINKFWDSVDTVTLILQDIDFLSWLEFRKIGELNLIIFLSRNIARC